MNLIDYIVSPGSLTIPQLRERIGAKSDAQVRQWVHRYAGRRPGPVYCQAIERATGGAVTRRDLRPDDWHLIWPELAATPAQQEVSHG